MKKLHVTLILLLTVLTSIFMAACGGTSTGTTATPAATTGSTSAPAAGSPTCVASTLKTNGSTALGPLVQAVAKDYQAACAGSSITTALTGSGAGLTAVSGGNADIGNSDVYADPKKFTGLVDHQVAVVVFSVVINSKVTGVTNLTSAQINSIFTGKTTNWKDLGGPDLPIVAVNRPTGSGTRVTFEQFVNGGPVTVTGSSVVTASTTGDVAKNVSQTDGAISYVAASAVAPNNLTAIKIDGVDNSDANVLSNTYKFWNIEHMYTKGDAAGIAKAFIDYMTSDAAKAHAKTLGFLDVTTLSADTLATRKPAGY
ncbi:MAG TPA: extracellular solute-binding protein [Ktedonosporobacter sp.]|nr:extracellular solute-binding protein [Ktedonosporobacter sp.]